MFMAESYFAFPLFCTRLISIEFQFQYTKTQIISIFLSSLHFTFILPFSLKLGRSGYVRKGVTLLTKYVPFFRTETWLQTAKISKR
jgi:hypothetical protein